MGGVAVGVAQFAFDAGPVHLGDGGADGEARSRDVAGVRDGQRREQDRPEPDRAEQDDAAAGAVVVGAKLVGGFSSKPGHKCGVARGFSCRRSVAEWNMRCGIVAA